MSLHSPSCLRDGDQGVRTDDYNSSSIPPHAHGTIDKMVHDGPIVASLPTDEQQERDAAYDLPNVTFRDAEVPITQTACENQGSFSPSLSEPFGHQKPGEARVSHRERGAPSSTVLSPVGERPDFLASAESSGLIRNSMKISKITVTDSCKKSPPFADRNIARDPFSVGSTERYFEHALFPDRVIQGITEALNNWQPGSTIKETPSQTHRAGDSQFTRTSQLEGSDAKQQSPVDASSAKKCARQPDSTSCGCGKLNQTAGLNNSIQGPPLFAYRCSDRAKESEVPTAKIQSPSVGSSPLPVSDADQNNNKARSRTSDSDTPSTELQRAQQLKNNTDNEPSPENHCEAYQSNAADQDPVASCPDPKETAPTLAINGRLFCLASQIGTGGSAHVHEVICLSSYEILALKIVNAKSPREFDAYKQEISFLERYFFWLIEFKFNVFGVFFTRITRCDHACSLLDLCRLI